VAEGDEKSGSQTTDLEHEGEEEGKAESPPEASERDESEGKDEQEERSSDGDDEDACPGAVKIVLLALGTIVLTLLGLYIFSALIAPTYLTAIILGVVWFLLAAYLVMRLRRRKPRWGPVLAGAFGLTVAVLVVAFLVSVLSNTTAHEQVVSGVKLSEAKTGGGKVPKAPTNGQAAPKQNIVSAAGTFSAADNGSATGNAAFITTKPNGQVKLVITKLDMGHAPTMHVYLAPKDGTDTAHALDLGSLKGNKGDQQYDVPPGTDIKALHTVVIYSKILTVALARAPLKAQ
jgi:hypothetical protein